MYAFVCLSLAHLLLPCHRTPPPRLLRYPPPLLPGQAILPHHLAIPFPSLTWTGSSPPSPCHPPPRLSPPPSTLPHSPRPSLPGLTVLPQHLPYHLPPGLTVPPSSLSSPPPPPAPLPTLSPGLAVLSRHLASQVAKCSLHRCQPSRPGRRRRRPTHPHSHCRRRRRRPPYPSSPPPRP